MHLPSSLSRKSTLLGFGLTGALLAAAGIAFSAGDPPPSGVAPTSGYSISGTVDTLQPGVTTHLTLTVSNPQTTRLFLDSVTAKVDSATLPNGSPAPAECAGYLDPQLPHTWTSWDGPQSVAPASDSSHPGTVTLVVALSFADTNTNQDACQGVTYNFKYSGSAYYTDPTSTGLVTSPNPANAGAPVTMKATVTSTYSGASPIGTVTFAGPNGPIGSPVPLVPAGGSNTSTATMSTSSLPSGSDQITATYNPSGAANGGPDFDTSATQANQSVVAGCVTGPTSNATTVIGPGQTYKGNLRITSGQSVWLNGGTITGKVDVDAGGKLAGNGGQIGGDLHGDGDVALQGTTVSGNIDTDGGMSLGYGTTVTGNVHATNATGPTCMNAVTVGKDVHIEKLAAGARVCQVTAGGNVDIHDNGGSILFGGTNTCAGNKIDGNIEIHNNSGVLTVGAAGLGNQATGNIHVQDNKGGGTVTANSAGKDCELKNNSPGITGSANTVTDPKKNTCNGVA